MTIITQAKSECFSTYAIACQDLRTPIVTKNTIRLDNFSICPSPSNLKPLSTKTNLNGFLKKSNIYIYIYIKTLAMVGFLASLLYRTVS